MSESEVFDHIIKYLNMIFPRDSVGPFWEQEPYRSDLFQIFAASYDACPLSGDRIWYHLRDQWFPSRNMSDKDRQTVYEICRSWGQWRYAWDKFSRGEGDGRSA